jgi:Ca-activated chloride channel family protein
MNQPTSQDLHEARLTAFALDELSGDERVEVERLLAAGTPAAAAAAREIARIREAGTLLTRELARELGDGHAPALTPAQRAAISRAATPLRPRPMLRWSLAAACAALAAALVVAVLVPGGGPGIPEVAMSAPSHPPKDAEEKDGGRLARGASGAPAPSAAAPGAAAKQEEQLAAPAVALRDLGGVDAAQDNKRGTATANQAMRKKERELEAAADGSVAQSVPPRPAAAPGAPGGAGTRPAAAGELQDRLVADAAPAPAAAASVPPAAPAAPPPATERLQLAARPAAKAAEVNALREAPAPGARAQGAGGGRAAGAAAGPAGAPAADPLLFRADRVRYVQSAALADQEAVQGVDKSAAARGPAAADGDRPVAAAAPALHDVEKAVGSADDGMMPTGMAATVEVPVSARAQSFASLRRCLDAGSLPPPALVQVGELLNAVPVQRPGQGLGTATIGISAGPCPWQSDHQLLGIVIAARPAVDAPRPALNLVLLLDVSAAMGDRLSLVRNNLDGLVRGLGAADRLSLVACSTQARLVIDGVSGGDASALLTPIAGLTAATDAGAADAAAGLALAVQALSRSHRAGSRDEVVWCTAGVPRGDQALADQVRRLAADGVGLQLMAVGHDHAEDGALERLAALGHGGFAYLATSLQAMAALRAISAPHEAVARQALAEVAFDPAVIASYRVVGAPPMSPLPSADPAGGGVLCAGQTMTLLVEVARAPQLAGRRLAEAGKDGAGDPALVSVRLTYLLADGRPGTPITARLGVAEAARQDGSELLLVAAAAELGLGLRHPGDPRYQWERMLANARTANVDEDGAWFRRELIDLITRAAALSAKGGAR